MPSTNVTLIIPCYNEKDGLPQLIARLDAMRMLGHMEGWEVLLVNDGSKDGTGDILDNLAYRLPWVRVAHHVRNKGLGAAVRTGFAHSDSPIVCTMDSDCTFAPETLPRMVAMLQEGADIVTASPWSPESEKSTCHPLRGLLSKGASTIYRLILGDAVHSFTPMHRAYRREVIKKIQFESNGFSAIAEILIRAMSQGFRVKELPMPVAKRQFGESKINIFGSIMSHLSLMRMAAGISLSGWYERKFSFGRLAVDK